MGLIPQLDTETETQFKKRYLQLNYLKITPSTCQRLASTEQRENTEAELRPSKQEVM